MLLRNLMKTRGSSICQEADVFFSDFKILHKEKRMIEKVAAGKRELQAFIDYIAQKK